MITRTRSYPRRPIRRRLHTLPALEFDDYGDVVCPHCGAHRTLQHTELQLRWWNISAVAEDGTIMLDDGDTGDDGFDQNWSCWSCGMAWDYETGPEVSYG